MPPLTGHAFPSTLSTIQSAVDGSPFPSALTVPSTLAVFVFPSTRSPVFFCFAQFGTRWPFAFPVFVPVNRFRVTVHAMPSLKLIRTLPCYHALVMFSRTWPLRRPFSDNLPVMAVLTKLFPQLVLSMAFISRHCNNSRNVLPLDVVESLTSPFIFRLDVFTSSGHILVLTRRLLVPTVQSSFIAKIHPCDHCDKLDFLTWLSK